MANVTRWDSLDDLFAFCHRHAKRMDRGCKSQHDDKDADWRRGIEDATSGRADLAEPLMNAFEAVTTTAERDAHEWRDDQYIGASVSVARYSMGLPGCVRRRETMPQDYKHVSVYVSVTTTYQITRAQRAKRGAAVLGLLQRLQSEGCGIDLYAYSEIGRITRGDADGSGDMLSVVRVPTLPFDLTALAGVFCSRAFGYGIGTCGLNIGVFGAPPSGPWPSISERNDRYRDAMGLAPSDILVPAVHIHDRLLDNPQAWIEARTHQALRMIETRDE